MQDRLVGFVVLGASSISLMVCLMVLIQSWNGPISTEMDLLQTDAPLTDNAVEPTFPDPSSKLKAILPSVHTTASAIRHKVCSRNLVILIAEVNMTFILSCR